MKSYSQFAQKYDDFMVPSMEITIGGKKLTEQLGCVTSGVNVSLALGDISTASFQIGDCYDLVTRSIKSTIKNNMKLGSRVNVKLGYGSTRKLVFKGYIDSMSLSYSAESGFTYDISAADVVKLLKEGGNRRREFKVKTYAEAFKKVMADYGDLGTPKADSMTGELKTALFQDGTDYDFIMKDLIEEGKADFEFFVSVGTAYYRAQKSTQDIITELKPGAGLKSCNFSFQYLNREVKVLGYSPDMKEYTASATAKVPNLDTKAVKGTEVIVIYAEQQEVVTAKANWHAKSLEKRTQNGSLTVIGLPELIPGSGVKIGDVDTLVNGTYNITGVKHSLGSSGFTSELTIGG